MLKRIIHITPSNSPHVISLINARFSGDYDEFDNRIIVYGDCEKQKEAEIRSSVLKPYAVYFCSNFLSLFFSIIKLKCRIVVCHGDSYAMRTVPLLCGCKATWVCWGSYTTLSGTLLSYITYPYKFLVNHLQRYIVALMISDKEDLERTYHLNNVIVLPYPSRQYEQIAPLGLYDLPFHYPVRVLIGNSGHCAPWYKDVIKLLSKFANKIEVHCMFQYPQWQDVMSDLSQYGTSLLGKSFCLDTDFLSSIEYINYLSSYDIYICPKPTQSGLGAIHTALVLGKKVYLTGKNFEWERYLGAKVYDIETIESEGYDTFSCELSPEDKQLNRRQIVQHWDRVKEWVEFYKSL